MKLSWKKFYQFAHRKHQDKTSPSAVRDFGYLKTNFPDVNKANGKNMCIKNFLNWMGHVGDRTNSMGIPQQHKIPKFNIWSGKEEMIEGKVRWRKQNSKNGRGDVTGSVKGVYCLFETKTPNDRLSKDQLSFHSDVRADGGQVCVVGPIEDFFNWYVKFTGFDVSVLCE